MANRGKGRSRWANHPTTQTTIAGDIPQKKRAYAASGFREGPNRVPYVHQRQPRGCFARPSTIHLLNHLYDALVYGGVRHSCGFVADRSSNYFQNCRHPRTGPSFGLVALETPCNQHGRIEIP